MNYVQLTLVENCHQLFTATKSCMIAYHMKLQWLKFKLTITNIPDSENSEVTLD